MKTVSFEDLQKELKNRNINLSYQRLKILQYLTNSQIHPTVDQIFTDLHKDIPTLSKTTVYNTLKLLVQSDLAKVLTIEDNETRYDINIENHGHFKCESCGEIYDFTIDLDSIANKELKNFKINDKKVYFKGICPRCLN
ncbi:MAG: transcriptional repressor [Tissierellia bacterium]|nr:transcriptional repressor [Tissierellia bacterium]MDD4726528.1 transcriptional repressor [Tissierellia bacterium]